MKTKLRNLCCTARGQALALNMISSNIKDMTQEEIVAIKGTVKMLQETLSQMMKEIIVDENKVSVEQSGIARNATNVEVPGSNPGRDTICCRKCWEREHARKALQVEGAIINPLGMPMIVCSMCGNKRCPHATDHNLLCTGSNDVGQTGSIY